MHCRSISVVAGPDNESLLAGPAGQLRRICSCPVVLFSLVQSRTARPRLRLVALPRGHGSRSSLSLSFSISGVLSDTSGPFSFQSAKAPSLKLLPSNGSSCFRPAPNRRVSSIFNKSSLTSTLSGFFALLVFGCRLPAFLPYFPSPTLPHALIPRH